MRSHFAIDSSRLRALHILLIAIALAATACVKVNAPVAPAKSQQDAGETGPSQDAASATTTDAGDDAAFDAGADASPAADDASAPSALMLCDALDTRWGLEPNGDRASTWANDISFAYATALGGDCRISNLALTLSDDAQIEYINHLIAWTMEVFGCPSVMSDASTLTYGLTETGTASVYTTADLGLLSTLYVGALEQAISDIGADPLDADTLDAVRAQLDSLAAMKSSVVKSDLYSLDACTTGDAGAVSDAGADAN